jgi:uroporphyrinogen decarboxylase
VVSPKVFERFSVPYVSEFHANLLAKGVKKWIVHLCGDHTRNLPHWGESIPLAPRTIFTVGHEMDIEHTAAFFGAEHIIGGNVATTTLQLGTAAEVFALCREVIGRMKYHPGGFILMPACALPPKTPPENVQAMMAAAKEFGRYEGEGD